MYQVTFSNQCMGEINKLDKIEQLELIDTLASITRAQLEKPEGDLGVFHRNHKDYYRLRKGDWRVYFELDEQENILRVVYILHKHTLADFVFRFKLPFAEETMIEQQDNFWRYIESLRNNERK